MVKQNVLLNRFSGSYSTYGKMPKLLEQYEWYSLQKKYKILVHTLLYIIVLYQQKLKNAGQL